MNYSDDNDIQQDLRKISNKIQQLQKALRLACGELSTYGPHTNTHPQQLYDDIMNEAISVNE